MTDYHDFVTKDTPMSDRRKLNIGDLWINAAKCLICNETIRSRNQHDFVTCKCGNVSVDGGSWYARRVFKTEEYEDILDAFSEVSDDQ